MNLIDTHCHLPNLNNKGYLEEILGGAIKNGVEKIITIGTNLYENEQTISTIQTYPQIYAALGIFPHEHLNENIENLMENLKNQIIKNKKVLAVGECGLDINPNLQSAQNQRSVKEQIDLFEAQIKVAKHLQLPIIVHNRNADNLILEILTKHYSKTKTKTGVVHCFDSNWELAKSFLSLGFYISFTGFITYESHKHLEQVVKNIPNNKYMLETDSPFILPEPIKTTTKGLKIKNEPKYVKIIAQRVAEIKGQSISLVAKNSTQNAYKVFKFG